MPETFNFPYHTPEVRYPESSARVQYGKGYSFASAPNAPDQVQYLLHFNAMRLFSTWDGEIDYTTEPELNFGLLIQFYERHRLFEKFIYPHVIYGNQLVRFANPLTYKMSDKGGGVIEPFTLEFTLQP